MSKSANRSNKKSIKIGSADTSDELTTSASDTGGLSYEDKLKLQTERVDQLRESLKQKDAFNKQLEAADDMMSLALKDLRTKCGVEAVQLGKKEYAISHRGDRFFLKS